jgi:hypothetical protein
MARTLWRRDADRDWRRYCGFGLRSGATGSKIRGRYYTCSCVGLWLFHLIFTSSAALYHI